MGGSDQATNLTMSLRNTSIKLKYVSSLSGDQARVADFAATVRTIGVAYQASIEDKEFLLVGIGGSFDRALPTAFFPAAIFPFYGHQLPGALCRYTSSSFIRGQATRLQGLWFGGSGWQALPGDFEEFVAVLGEQVQGVDDVGNVARVGVFESVAIECLKQAAGGADALAGGVEDFVWVGLGVDDQHRGVAVAGLERVEAVGQRAGCVHRVAPV